MELTAEQVLAWRLKRQLLDRVGSLGAVEVVDRLCGVQAQVASYAESAVAVRQIDPSPGGLPQALADRALMKPG